MKSEKLETSVTPEERTLIERAAKLQLLPRATWMRRVIVHAANAEVAKNG